MMKYMKIFSLYLKFSLFILFMVLVSPEIKSQSDFSIGANVGSGYISGNSPKQTSLNTSIFLQMKTFLSNVFYTRLSFFYNRDIDYYLGTRSGYFPFIKGVSLKGISNQDLANNFFLEEGFGFLYINDRTFSDTNSDDLGVVFSLTTGTDLRKYTNLKMKLGVGIEYGLTFNSTLASYLSVHLQGEYYF